MVHIHWTVASISNILPEGIDYPPDRIGRGIWKTSRDICKRFAIPLKNKEQLIVLKTIQGSSPNYSLSIDIPYTSSQSREIVPLTNWKIPRSALSIY
jgi:hypothetical protein